MAAEILSDRSLKSELILAQARAKEKNTRMKVRDGNNLMLVVRQNGGASWVLEYRLANHKRKPHTIGPWPTVTLSKARELANAARLLTAEGKDPNVEKKAAKEVVAKAVRHGIHTVKVLFDEWLGKMEISEVYQGNIRAAFIKDVLPAIGYKHPSEVTGKEINLILRELEARDATVMLKNVRMWIRQMFEYAVGHDGYDIDTNPTPGGRNKSFKTRKGGHYPAITNPDQCYAMMQKIVSRQNTITRSCLIFHAHVFQRPTEVRDATWREFDLENAIWTIPAGRMKKAREHWVPLSPYIVDFLKKHQGVVGDDPDGFLFPGRGMDKAISENTPNKALNDLGYKGIHCPHGFRAMARTIMAERLKIDERFLEKQLSHELEGKEEAAYNRAEYWDDRVELMHRWSEWLNRAKQPLVP